MKTNKFLKLFSSILFGAGVKENRVVKRASESGPSRTPESTTAPATSVGEQAVKIAEHQEEIFKLAKAERKETGEETAKEVTLEDAINKTLEELANSDTDPKRAQEIFDFHVRGLEIGSSLGASQVEALIRYCSSSTNKTQNFEKVLNLIKSRNLDEGSLNSESKYLLLDHFRNDKSKTRELLETPIKYGNGESISEWIDVATSQNSIGIIYELISPEQIKEIQSPSALFRLAINTRLSEEFLNKLGVSQKIIILNKFSNKGAKERIFSHISQSKEKSFESLNPELLNILVQYAAENNHIKFLDTNLNNSALALISNKIALSLLSKVESKYKKFFKRIIDNLNESTKDYLVNITDQVPITVSEKILSAINPEIGKAIKKYNLKRINGEYRRVGAAKIWKAGKYYFKASAPTKLFYEDARGVQSTEFKDEKWSWDEKFEGFEEKGTEIDVHEKKFLQTTQETMLLDDQRKPLWPLDKGAKLSVISPKGIDFNGRLYLKVRFHEEGKEGWVETSLIEEYTPSEKIKKMDEDTESLYLKYFINFDNVEPTKREFATGEFRMKGKKSFYSENGMHPNLPGKIIVEDPKIYKLSKKGQHAIYVVKFKETEDGPSSYIDVNDIGQLEDSKKTVALAASEWTSQEEYREDLSIPKGSFSLKKGAKLFGYKPEDPHRYTSVEGNAEVIDEKIRIVEGKEYAKVKTAIEVNGKSQEIEGWVEVKKLDIPKTELTIFEGESDTKPEEAKYGEIWDPETGEIKFENRKQELKTKLRDIFPQTEGYKIIITSKKTGTTRVAQYIEKSEKKRDYYFVNDLTGKIESRALVWNGDNIVPFKEIEDKPQESPNTDILGYFEATPGQKASEIIKTIYDEYPGLEESVRESGLSDIAYYKTLLKYKEGNRLKVIKPSSTKFEFSKEVQTIKAGQKHEIDLKTQTYLDQSDHYLSHKFKIDESLLTYVNNDDQWNDLWDKRGGETNKYIEGINKVISIMGKYFHETDISIRGKLRELIQIGYNKHVDMEDVFKSFAGKLGYKKSWDTFKKEIKDNKKIVQEWETKKADKISEIQDFQALEAKILARKAEKRTQGEEYQYIQSTEYKMYLVKKLQVTKTLESYEAEYIPAQNKLQDLAKNVLLPMSELLDAIEGMELKVSKPAETYYELEKIFGSHLPSTSEKSLQENPTFYELEHLMSGRNPKELAGNQLDNLVERKEYAVTLGKRFRKDFDKIAKANDVDPSTFSNEQILKIVFQAFSLETLAKQKCVRRLKGKANQLVLVDLPHTISEDSAKSSAAEFGKLIKEIGSGDKVAISTAKIKEVGAKMDASLRAIKKLSQIFPEETQDIKTNWRDAFVGFFTGADTREVEYTMSALAEGKVTKPAADVLEQYMSSAAAKGEIMDDILDMYSGIETFDINQLKTELTNKASIGIDFLPMMKTKVPQLEALYNEVFKDGRSAEDAKKYYEEKIKEFLYADGELDQNLKELIRFGHFNHRIIEENKKTFEYSENKQISIIQKALVKKRIAGLTQKDLDKVEQVMIGGIGFGVASDGSGGGVGFAVPIDLGDGWTLSVGAAVGSGESGVMATPTVSLSKKFALGERHSLKFSIDGTMFSIGGSVQYSFPINEDHEMSLGAGAGVTVVGFYAGGGFGVRKDTGFEQKAAFEKTQKELGFEEVNALIKDPNATEKTIADAICRMQGVGKEFKSLREDYNLTSSVIVELFEMKKDQIETALTTELGPDGFDFSVIGGGAWAGVVNGIPVVAGYLEIKWGNELVVVRSTMPGYEDTQGISDAIINEKIQAQLGGDASILRSHTGDTGQLVYDAETGSPAILTKKYTNLAYEISRLDSQSRLDSTLHKIDIHGEKDPSTGLTRLFIGGVEGNLKIVKDPAIEEHLTVQDNKILIAMDTSSGLIFTRQEYYYPYKAQGQRKLTIITIKKNPKKTTAMLLQEAPAIVHQRPGYLPEIRKGLGTLKEGQAPTTTSYKQYKKSQLNVPEGERLHLAHQTTPAGYLEYAETLDNIVKPDKYYIRTGLGSFAESFYKNHRVLYKKLSTYGTKTHNPEKLVALIQKEAKSDPNTSKRALSEKELSLVLTDLMGRGFMDIKEKRKTFLHNLRFAQKVLTKFFTKSTKGRKLKYSPSQMAAHIVEELKSTNITSKSFEKIPFGTQMLSVVGTDKIVGMRGTLTYEDDPNGGILNLQRYRPGASGIEGEIGRTLLELVSPLDTASDKAFMESGLSLKMIGHPGTYFLLGEENALRVARCFRDKVVSTENKAAFEKFKAIVLEIRKSQLAGKNFIEGDGKLIPKGYKIKLSTMVGVGAYSKCGNASPLVHEGIDIMLPSSAAARDKTYITLKSQTKRRDITSIVGVAVYVPPEGGTGGDTPDGDPEPEGEVAGGAGVEGAEPEVEGLGGSGGIGLE